VDEWQELLRNVQAYLGVGGCAIVLAIVIWIAPPNRCRPLLPLPRLRRSRWGGNDVLLAVLTSYFAQLAAVVVLAALVALYHFLTAEVPFHQGADTVDPARLLILGSPLYALGTVAIVCGLLYLGTRTRPPQLGLTLTRWRANVIVGVLTFLVMAPLTLGVYFLAIHILGPEQHPLERLIEQGFAPWEWASLVFMTVVGAPLVEELVFRGVLQGWLRRASPIGHTLLMAAVLTIGAKPIASFLGSGLFGPPAHDLFKIFAPLVFNGALVVGYLLWLTVILTRYRRNPLRLGPVAWDWASARLSIYGSAMLFGAVHGWPQSLPLFLLGLGLGWLAYRTQSLIGCMVCHALFNAVACLVLYWGTTT
jgi:membrane protease YdiL (CAAX protease family)